MECSDDMQELKEDLMESPTSTLLNTENEKRDPVERKEVNEPVVKEKIDDTNT